MPQTGATRFVDKIKKHWIVVLFGAIVGFLIFADDAVQAGKHLWEIVVSIDGTCSEITKGGR